MQLYSLNSRLKSLGQTDDNCIIYTLKNTGIRLFSMDTGRIKTVVNFLYLNLTAFLFVQKTSTLVVIDARSKIRFYTKKFLWKRPVSTMLVPELSQSSHWNSARIAICSLYKETILCIRMVAFEMESLLCLNLNKRKWITKQLFSQGLARGGLSIKDPTIINVCGRDAGTCMSISNNVAITHNAVLRGHEQKCVLLQQENIELACYFGEEKLLLTQIPNSNSTTFTSKKDSNAQVIIK